MTFRTSVTDAARRAYQSIFRGTFVSADDSKKMQEITVRGMHGEQYSGVEHWHPSGFSTVPMPPKDGKEAEVLPVNVGGDDSHPIAIATADRRTRPTDLKPGDAVLYDPRDNRRRVHFSKDGGLVITVPEDTTITKRIGNVEFKWSKDGLDVTGGHIKHDGKKIDSTHVHEGVQPGSGITGGPEE